MPAQPTTRRPLALAPFLLFAAAGGYLLRHYQYPILDLVSYISVARKYAALDLGGAINGCWGPLVSWLVVPLLWLGVEPVFGYRLVALGVGAATLLGIRSLSLRLPMTEGIRLAVLCTAALLLLGFAYVPDLTLTCVLVYYLRSLLHPDYLTRCRHPALCGLFGALGYFSKGYGFAFFLLHYFLVHAVWWLRGKPRRAILRGYATGMLVFALLCGSWIALISAKYDRLTVNAAARYHHAVYGPDSEGHPTYQKGFFAPPDDTAVSIWEDPSLIEVPDWSPLDSWRHFTFAVQTVATNCVDVAVTYFRFSVLALPILAWFGVLAWRHRRAGNPAVLLLLTVLVYPIGYLFIDAYSESGRYLWLSDYLILLMGGYCLHLVFQRFSLGSGARAIAVALLALSFLPMPAVTLRRALTVNHDTYLIGNQIEDLGIAGTTAANSSLHQTLYLASRLGCQSFGIQRQDMSDDELEVELARLGVDWFFVWRRGSQSELRVPAFLLRYPEVTGGKIDRLKIFALRRQ